MVGTLYHCSAVPVAVREATVGLALEQNVCGEVAVGAAGVVIFILCEDVLTHPSASVTCSVTTKVPDVAYVCDGFCEVEVEPSPNCHK